MPSVWDLWLRYFALGGMGSPVEVARHISGAATMGDHENDILVHALNKRFDELHVGSALPYSRD